MDASILRKAANVNLMVFDVDGVLTDGKLYCAAGGGELKRFDVKDGHGIRLLLHHGVEVAIASARESTVVSERMAELGVAHVYQGCRDKAAVIAALSVRLDVEAARVAYMGDDLVDLPAMRRVGLALAPADAHREILQCAAWVSSRAGGDGAAREACDLLLRARRECRAPD